MKRKGSLTKKQKKLVDAVVANPTGTLDEWGQHAAYSDRQGVHRALKVKEVQDELALVRDLMDAEKRTKLSALVEHLAEGLNATELRAVKLEGSKLKVSAEVKDYAVRHKYLETALELRGVVRQQKDEAPSGPINIALILMGGGSEAEKAAVADAMLAARLARGLHPTENRPLTPEEAATYRRAP